MDEKRQETLELLFDATIQELLLRIKNGDAKPADLANAIRILKDNNIQADSEQYDPFQNLFENLPHGIENN